MGESGDPLCFGCGNPTSDPPRIQYLPSGEPCPHCRDRFIDSLPSLLPGRSRSGSKRNESQERDVHLGPGDAYPGSGHRA